MITKCLLCIALAACLQGCDTETLRMVNDALSQQAANPESRLNHLGGGAQCGTDAQACIASCGPHNPICYNSCSQAQTACLQREMSRE